MSTDKAENAAINVINVAVDDGSGNIAYAYTNESGVFVSGMRESVVQNGKAFSTNGRTSKHTWMDTQTSDIYTAADTDTPLPTCSTSYQTSVANRTLVIDTLANYADLAGKTVNIGVTLPAGQFFDPRTNEPNHDLIEAKKANLLRPMSNSSNAVAAPKINAVHVFPEAIPAYFYAASNENGEISEQFADISRALIIDIGQFTCDLAMIRIRKSANGKRDIAITKLNTSENGVHKIHTSLMNQIANKVNGSIELNRSSIEQMIKRGYIGSSWKGAESTRIDISSEINGAASTLVELVNKQIRELHDTPSDVDLFVLVGGGAHLLEKSLNENPNIFGCPTFIPKNPELAVVIGVYQLMSF